MDPGPPPPKSLADDAARRRATAIGAGAILLWATLAALAAGTSAIPPFERMAIAFGLAGALSLIGIRLRGGAALRALRQPARAWVLGIYGLFGYHSLYFVALSHAPAVEANLIQYLWPLLIVLLSGLLPGERLRSHHLLGAGAGLAGTALLLGDVDLSGSSEHALGFAAALGAALVWSSYSVLSRALASVPSEATSGILLACAALAGLAHVALEETLWPTAPDWGLLALMAAGPLGLAFFLWDHGVKRGDLRALGAASYATPLLSTLLLVLTGAGSAGWPVAAACALIVGGAALAGRDLLTLKG